MTNEELYDSLLEKGFDGAYINQMLKSREDGYDIYNSDLPLQTDKIREYRKFLLENLEPVFNHGQLREIELGWFKGLDVLEYANPKYSKEEMCILRKALENKKDISLIKTYGTDYATMTEVSKAIGNGFTKSDFEKYSMEQVSLFNKSLKKDKIDIRPLLENEYSERQIEKILQVSKTCKNITDYINNRYDSSAIAVLAEILSTHNYEDIKTLFNPDFIALQISELRFGIENKVNWEIVANPEYPVYKMRIAIGLMINEYDKDTVEKFLSTDLSSDRYYKINYYLQGSGFNYDEALIDKKIPDRCFKFLKPGSNLIFFKKLAYDNYPDKLFMTIMQAKEYGINLLPYVKPDCKKDIFVFFDCLKFIEYKGIKDIDKQFIFDNVDDQQKKDIFTTCIKYKIDYKSINYDISLSQLNQIIFSPYKDKLALLLKPGFPNSQINAIKKALEENLNISNLLTENLDSAIYTAILKLERFNAENKRQINIKELIDLNLPIKELGPLIGKLTSNNLEDNLLGYKQISTYQSKEKIKEEPER